MELLHKLAPIAFYILATTSVVCALGMIFNPNLVRAGFTLVGSFASIAGLFFMLNANFVAVSQILIYAVGIVLVIIFAIMLCSLKPAATEIEHHAETVSGLRNSLAAFVCTFLFLLLVFIIYTQDWEAIALITGATQHQYIISEISKTYTAQIGNLMLSKYLLPFELISVLLLMILVGTIILSKKKLDPEEPNA